MFEAKSLSFSNKLLKHGPFREWKIQNMFGIIHYGCKETILKPIFILNANFGDKAIQRVYWIGIGFQVALGLF